MGELIKISDYQVVKDYVVFFRKIFDETTQGIKPFSIFFQHQKRYRRVLGVEALDKRFYIKEYVDHFDEAESEWENLFLLKSLGFSVPNPFFIHKTSAKIQIATFELKGIPLSELLVKDRENKDMLLYKLAELISALHLKKLYHQDCYLNHFYWDEEIGTLGFLDVARVLLNPRFSSKNRIKDLAQLGYSFEEYMEEKGKLYFQKFLSCYLELSGIERIFLLKSTVEFKIWLIRKRTENVRKKGKKL